MILSTHAVIGAAAAAAVKQNPALAFLFGAASHFLSDAIPHWHYPLHSLERDRNNPLENKLNFNRRFAFDLLVIGTECIAGFLLALWAVPASSRQFIFSIFLGSVGGVLPDFLQFLYYVYPRPFKQIQIFHKWIHAKTDLNSRPVLGISSQLLIFLLALWLIRLG